METVAVTEEKVKTKRGRKPSKNRKGYFHEGGLWTDPSQAQ